MKYLLIVMLLIGFAACNKRKTCSSPRSRIGSVIAFKGFNAQELDTIVIRQYAADGLFAQANRSDTLIMPPVVLMGDIAVTTNGYGFWGINEGADYEVILPAASQIFHITGIRYLHDAPYTYESDEKGFCWEQGSFFSSPDSVAIEQVPVTPRYYNGSATFVFLAK